MFEYGLGFITGALVAILIFTILAPMHEDGTIKKVMDAQHDCLNPYYYYGDDGHKTFCDKIAVKPAGNITGTTGGQ